MSPSPNPIPNACRRSSTFPGQAGEALYVGDAAVDRLVAGACRSPLVAYKNPSLQADYHLQDHLELLPLLGLPG